VAVLRKKLLSRVRPALAMLVVSLGMTACADGDMSLPDTRCRGHVGAAHVIASGDDFGGWQVIAYDGWDQYEYAVMFDHPQAFTGCGLVGDQDAPLAQGGGAGQNRDGRFQYVFGAALNPVESVTVLFNGGPVLGLPLKEIPGMRHRFFGVMAPGEGGWSLEGRDAGGQLVSRL
jgi:hypothetical protein